MGHYFTNDPVSSNQKKHQIKIKNRDYYFWTDNGVFSKNHLDYGSELLIETLPVLTGRVLDVGCGYGVIGISLAATNDIIVDMIDVNERAISLTKMNIEANKIKNANAFISDAYSNVSETYNYIVSNPPIRVGKEKLYEILFAAQKHLQKDGEFYFVMNKNQGAKSAMKDLEKDYYVEILAKSKGFYIIKLKIR